MNKETRKELFSNRYSDLTAICERFEKMESEGWRLTSLGYLAEYRRCEPRKVRYSAELLDAIIPTGSGIPERFREYIDLCEQTGWSLAGHFGSLCIFRSENEDAPEIVSDPEEKLQNIRQATMRGFISQVLVIPLLFMQFFLMIFLVKSPAVIATTQLFTSQITFVLFIVGYFLLHDIQFLHWYRKAKRAVREGKPIPYKDTKAVKRTMTREKLFIAAVLLAPILLALPLAMRGEYTQLRQALMIFVVVSGFFLAYRFRKTRHYSTSKTLIIAMAGLGALIIIFGVTEIVVRFAIPQKPPIDAITTDARGDFLPNLTRIPVTISDLAPVSGEIVNEVDGESTILATLYQYKSTTGDSETDFVALSYDIYYSRIPGLIDSYVRTLEKDDAEYGYGMPWEWIDAKPWGAKEAYQLAFEGDCIIVYDQYVLVVKLYTDLNDPDMEEVAGVFKSLLG